MSFNPKRSIKYKTGPNGGNLKIVVLDCPYDTIHSSETQSLLSKIFSMKIAGYQKHYQYGVLPVDTCDFVATHLVLCEETNGGLEPLMGMKFTTLERCKLHNLEFPLLHIVDKKYEKHHQSVEKTLNEIESNNESCAYSSSWTMSEIARQNPEFSTFCKNLNISLFWYYKETFRIKNIVDGSTVRFKIHEWKKFLGYEPFQFNNEPLDEVPCDPFFGEKILVMRLKNVSEEAKFFIKQFDYLWETRLTISADKNNFETNKAA